MQNKLHNSCRTLTILRNTALGILLITGLGSTAKAQIGSGWSSYSPGGRLQIEINGSIHEWDDIQNESKYDNDATFTQSGSTYTFEILNSACSRVEIRWEDNLTGGKEQFQGNVVSYSPVNNMHVFQIHGEVANAQELLDCDSGSSGEYKENGDATVATKIYGVSVRFNYIRNYSTKVGQLYINGSLKEQHSISAPASGDAYYSKCGIYGQGKGGKVTWSNVEFWH